MEDYQVNPWNTYLGQRDSTLAWESSSLWKLALSLNSVILIFGLHVPSIHTVSRKKITD